MISTILSFFLSFFPTMLTPYENFAYLPHQIEAINWMKVRESDDAEHVCGGILADEMGLGKTWMTVGLMLNSMVPNNLLLVPPALQPQWIEVLKKSGIPYRVLGSGTKGSLGTWKAGPGLRDTCVTISTYDRAYTKVDFLIADTTYDRIICDEGHVLRNGPSIRRFHELMRIPVKRKWILSGTPIQNRARDFHNLLTFLGMEPAKRMTTDIITIAKAVILRRTVGEVREFVPSMPTVKPVHIVHPVTMPKGSEEENVFQALVQKLEHAMEVHARTMIILELYLRIRQFLAHPSIYVASLRKKYSKAEYAREGWNGTASKAAAFADLMRTQPKVPTIVFATFRDEMDLAEVTLRDSGYKVYSVRGGLSEAARDSACLDSKVDAESGKPVAIVVQIVAGGAGLNLQHCSRVVFLSSHWNPAVVDQAIARAYRMGQTKTVEVHHLLMADSAEKNIDRVMANLHGEKRGVAMEIHTKLYCDSAIDTDQLMEELDAVVASEYIQE